MSNRIKPMSQASIERNKRRTARQKAASAPFLSDLGGMWVSRLADKNRRTERRNNWRAGSLRAYA